MQRLKYHIAASAQQLRSSELQGVQMTRRKSLRKGYAHTGSQTRKTNKRNQLHSKI